MLPRGVRPRLEGKQRTPLSSRVATRNKRHLSLKVRGPCILPGGSDGKSVCLQCGRPGFNPWVGKIPWRSRVTGGD